MSLHIDVQIEVPINEEEEKAVQWIERSLHSAGEVEQQPGEVSVMLVDDETIHRINREFRQVNRATDVLSFPQWDPDEERSQLPDGTLPLGDIIISLQRAKEQAAELGHSLAREVGFLAVHGFLHLLGYDHQTEEESQMMVNQQEKILQRIGLRR